MGFLSDFAAGFRSPMNQQGIAALAQAFGQAPRGYLGSALAQGAAGMMQGRQGYLAQLAEEEEERRRRQMELEETNVRRQEIFSRISNMEFGQQQALAAQEAAQAERQRFEQAAQQLAQQYQGDPLVEIQLSTAGDLGDLSDIARDAQERAQRMSEDEYLRSQGVDPNDPIAKERLKQKAGLGPQHQQLAPSYFNTAEGQRMRVDPYTGEGSPVVGPDGQPLRVPDPSSMSANERLAEGLVQGMAGRRYPPMTPQQVTQAYRDILADLEGGGPPVNPGNPDPGAGGPGGPGSPPPDALPSPADLRPMTMSEMVELTAGEVQEGGTQVAAEALNKIASRYGWDEATKNRIWIAAMSRVQGR